MPGHVFANATMLAAYHNELRYVEGLAYSFESGTNQLRHHAWCVDTQDRVVDPTWGNGIAYFGVVMQLSLACRTTGKVPNALQWTAKVWKETGGKVPPAPIAGFAKRKPIEKVARASQMLADRAESVGVYLNGPEHLVACGHGPAAFTKVKRAIRSKWKFEGELKPRGKREPWWALEIKSSDPTKDLPVVNRLLWENWLEAMSTERVREVGEGIQPDGKILRAITYRAMEKYRLPAS